LPVVKKQCPDNYQDTISKPAGKQSNI